MTSYTEPMPSYRDEGEINRFKKQIADLERELLAKTDTVNWFTAALCLMTDRKVMCCATGDFEEYLSVVPLESWKESGIKKKDLLAWKKAHDAFMVFYEEYTNDPEERKVLGL